MSIGDRDFVGAASFLSGVVRAGRAAASLRDSDGQDLPAPALTPEALLECLAAMKVANLQDLATSFGQAPAAIQPHISKLIDLGFVAEQGQDDTAAYLLTDLGRRAQKIAQIAQSGS